MEIADKYMKKYSDEELVLLVNKRNTAALKILFDRYNLAIFNFILRYTNNREFAEDVLQETFTRVWFAAHLFNPKKGNFKAWVFTVGLNITRNEMAKKRYSYQYVEMDEIPGEEQTLMESKFVHPEDLLERAELADTVTKAIQKLNPYLREVLILKHYQKLKFREIAEITNTPEGTLKARFHKAIAQLQKLLKAVEY